MTIFNTEWRNDSAADCASPDAVQQVAGLSPALGSRVFWFDRLTGGAALRPFNCGATECQAAVVPPSPAVESPRGATHVIDGTPSPADAPGSAPSDPPGTFFEIQQVPFLAMICGLLSVALACADVAVRRGFFIRGAACDRLHAAIVFFCLAGVCPYVSLIQGHVGTRLFYRQFQGG